MELSIKVKMQSKFIFDLLLYHTYSQVCGFLINLVALMVWIMAGLQWGNGNFTGLQAFLCILMGLALISYTPLRLKLQASRMMRLPRFAAPMTYHFDEEGISEEQGERGRSYPWSQVSKAIATPKDIAFYVKTEEDGASGELALILPKESFGEDFMPVMQLVTQKLRREQIYIR